MPRFFRSDRDVPPRILNISIPVKVRISESKSVGAFYSYETDYWYLTGSCNESGNSKKMSILELTKLEKRINRNVVLWTY